MRRLLFHERPLDIVQFGEIFYVGALSLSYFGSAVDVFGCEPVSKGFCFLPRIEGSGRFIVRAIVTRSMTWLNVTNRATLLLIKVEIGEAV